MNAMKTVLSTKTMTGLFLAAAFGGIARLALTPTQAVVFCDQKLPLATQEHIKQHIEKVSLRSVGAEGLLKELQAVYPSVKSLAIQYKGSLVAQVSVKAYQPRVRLTSDKPGQKEYIVCLGGLVLERSSFNEIITQNTATVIVAGESYEQRVRDSELIECVLALKGFHFEEYAITWRSKVDILLQSRTAHSILIADKETVHDKERFAYVDRILHADAARYVYGIKADIRLKDEIICAPLQEGVIKTHEESINV